MILQAFLVLLFIVAAADVDFESYGKLVRSIKRNLLMQMLWLKCLAESDKSSFLRKRKSREEDNPL